MTVRISMKLVGRPQVARRIQALSREVGGPALATATEAAALPLERAWKENISSYYAESGELGPGGKRGLVETGSYLRSVHHEPPEIEGERAVVLVGTDIVEPPYPVFLEFGTSRMPPKPTARPALDESQDEMRRDFAQAMRSQMSGIGR